MLNPKLFKGTTMSKLPYHFGVKIRCYPSQRQINAIKANSNDSRFFYNHLIAIDKRIWQVKCTPMYNPANKQLWIKNLAKMRLPKWTKCHSYLKQDDYLDSLCLALATNSHNLAWKNYRNGLQGVPQFHAKKQHPYEWKYQTYASHHKNKRGYKQNVYFNQEGNLKLPKMKKHEFLKTAYVRTLIWNKRDDIRIGTVTIQKNALDHFYVSLQLASDKPFVSAKTLTHKQAGIDLNVSNFLMDNHGNEVANPKFYTQTEPRLKKAQQAVSRRCRHAKNEHRSFKNDKCYQKARRKVAQLQTMIASQRKNFHEIISTKLIENQDLIVAENLQSKNLLRNHKLAQKISDVGWRSFLMTLQRKAQTYPHKMVVLVDPYNTTQKCSKCGYICNYEDNTHLDLGKREWTCPRCNHHWVRDQNASINILNRGNDQLDKIKSSHGNQRAISKMTEVATSTVGKCSGRTLARCGLLNR